MIRQATQEDMPRIIDMAVRFNAETSYRNFIDVTPERVAQSFETITKDPNSVILVSGSDGAVTGMIVMMICPHPFSGERISYEVVWWVDPESRGDGVKLLRAAEKFSKDSGVKKMHMIAPNDKVGHFYERLGYTQVEVAYQRSL